MTMPKLDPLRFVEMVLADPSHTLPMPDRGGRKFLAEGEIVDLHDPFYASLVADGSLRPKPPKAAPVEDEPEKPDVKPAPKSAIETAPKPALPQH